MTAPTIPSQDADIPAAIHDLAALAAKIGPVPRYTSYPTAPHFRTVADDVEWRTWLHRLPGSGIFSLYVHVPFCRQMCWYCGCHTQVSKNADMLDRYVRLLAREIELIAPYLPPGARLSGLHFGGGTPSIVGGDGLKRIAEQLWRHFTPLPQAEIAIEIDPRHFDAELAAALKSLGINRASLGVQSLDDKVQRAVNRVQPFEVVVRSVDALRGAGIDAVNFDLLYGLPHQTAANVVETAERCLTLQPERLALFGYAHVPWMKAHQARIDADHLPDTAQRFAQEAAAAKHIVSAGYRRIGLDHFARGTDALARRAENRTLHRNFQGYTTEAGEILLGFGPSAIGTLPQGYVQNIPSVAAWRKAVEEGRLPVARMRWLTPEDRLRRAVIEQLMCHLEVDLERLARQYDMPVTQFDADLSRLDMLREHGIVRRDGYRVTVPESGRPLVRQVAASFDAYLAGAAQADSTPRHAAA